MNRYIPCPPGTTPVIQTAWKSFVDSLDWNPGVTKNEQTYSAALRAASLGIDPVVATDGITEKIIDSFGEHVPEKVERQIARAYAYVLGEGASSIPGVKREKFTFDLDKLRAVAGNLSGLDDKWLAVRSPDRVVTTSTYHFLRRLYLPGETVIVFDVTQSHGQVAWRHVGAAPDKDPANQLPTGGPDGVWFLIQPVDGRYHPNPREGGTLSRRSRESVTAWRYLLLECDHEKTSPGVNALWLAALVQMPLPIAAIYTSGGRSIHALVLVNASSKEEWDSIKSKLLPVVIPLGADIQALSAVRLSRLPKCSRGTEMQRLLFLNPKADGTPIVDMRVCRMEQTAEECIKERASACRAGGRP